MSNRRFLLLIVAVSLGAVIILGGFNLFILTPAFTDLIVEKNETKAVKIAQHLLETFSDIGLNPESDSTSPVFKQLVAIAVNDFRLMKLKIFAADGRTVFSTSAAEIGVVNGHDYFRDRVARGEIFTKLVDRDTNSLENQLVSADVVETYVPIMENGKFHGAFEIYLDVTKEHQKLHALLFRMHLSMAILSTLLLGIVLFIARKADLSFIEQEKAEAEKKNLIAELRKALEEVKTLRGIIPICTYCKKIRDDEGMWNKLEAYIHEHSEAKFSHGICPECFAEQMEKLAAEEP
jgi:hypothetical protein